MELGRQLKNLILLPKNRGLCRQVSSASEATALLPCLKSLRSSFRLGLLQIRFLGSSRFRFCCLMTKPAQSTGDRPAVAPHLDPENWLDRYGDQLYNYALSRLRRHELAEEVVQDTLVSAVRSMNSFEGRSSEKTWLFAILKSKIHDAIRREFRRVQNLSLDDEANPEHRLFDQQGKWRTEAFSMVRCSVEAGELWNIVQQCLSKLPSNQANAFVLRVIEEKNTLEICKELQISASNLSARLYRARLGLAKCVADRWPS